MALRKSNGVNAAMALIALSSLSGGRIHIYSDAGVKPASANDVETGVLLAVITNEGKAHVAGSVTNGLITKIRSGSTDILEISTGQSWRGLWLADGTPSYFRVYGKDVVTGASTTAFRLDGDVGTLLSGEEMEVDSMVAVTGKEIVVSSATWTIA